MCVYVCTFTITLLLLTRGNNLSCLLFTCCSHKMKGSARLGSLNHSTFPYFSSSTGVSKRENMTWNNLIWDRSDLNKYPHEKISLTQLNRESRQSKLHLPQSSHNLLYICTQRSWYAIGRSANTIAHPKQHAAAGKAAQIKLAPYRTYPVNH